jgi:hypothetical protein
LGLSECSKGLKLVPTSSARKDVFSFMVFRGVKLNGSSGVYAGTGRDRAMWCDAGFCCGIYMNRHTSIARIWYVGSGMAGRGIGHEVSGKPGSGMRYDRPWYGVWYVVCGITDPLVCGIRYDGPHGMWYVVCGITDPLVCGIRYDGPPGMWYVVCGITDPLVCGIRYDGPLYMVCGMTHHCVSYSAYMESVA